MKRLKSRSRSRDNGNRRSRSGRSSSRRNNKDVDKDRKVSKEAAKSVNDRLLQMVQDQYNSAPVSAKESEEENSKNGRINKNEQANGEIDKVEGDRDMECTLGEQKKLEDLKEKEVGQEKMDMAKEQYGETFEGAPSSNDKDSAKAKKKKKKAKKKLEKKLKKQKKKEKRKNREKSKKKDKVKEAKQMKPMTKEEWEAQKSEVTTNFDSDGKPKSSIYYEENKQKHEDAYKWVLSGSPPPPHVRAAYKTFKRPQSQWSH